MFGMLAGPMYSLGGIVALYGPGGPPPTGKEVWWGGGTPLNI